METAEQVKGAPYRILNRKEIWEERRMIAKALTSQGAESIAHEHNCYDGLLEALNHAENEMLRLKASIAQLAPIRAAIAKAEGR